MRVGGQVYGREKISLPMEQIKSDRLSGMTLLQISKKYGVSKETIRMRLSEMGIEFTARKLPMEQVISEYESGASTYQLAEKYGFSRKTISRRLREAGVEMRKTTMAKTTNLPISKIWFEYESGISLRQLADKYGSDEPTLFKAIQRLQ